MATRFGGAHAFLTQTLVRLAIVGVIFGVAAGIPDFGNVVSLIGGLANALMGLILPRAPPSRATSLSLSLSLICTSSHRSRPSFASPNLAYNCAPCAAFFVAHRCRAALLVSLLGVVFLISSTYFTLHDMLV